MDIIYPLYKIYKGFIGLIVLSTFRTTDYHIIVGNENTNGNQDLVDLAKDCFEEWIFSAVYCAWFRQVT